MGLSSMLLVKKGLENLMDVGDGRTQPQRNHANSRQSSSYRPRKRRVEKIEIEDGLFQEKIYEEGLLSSDRIIDQSGRKVGRCIEYDPINLQYKLETYNRDGVLDGPYLEVFHHTITASGIYKNGKKFGPWITITTNGNILDESVYGEDGLLEGTVHSYHIEFQKDGITFKDISQSYPYIKKALHYKCPYKHGQPHGVAEHYGTYYDKGEKQYLREKVFYKNGERVASEYYYTNGTLQERTEREGNQEKISGYYPNGNLQYEHVDVNGQPRTRKDYDEDGHLIKERLDSKITCKYDEHGNIISRTFFANNKEYDFLKDGARELVNDNKKIKKNDRKRRKTALKAILKAKGQKNRAEVKRILKALRSGAPREELTARNLNSRRDRIA